MFAWLKSRGRFLRLFDIVIAPSIVFIMRPQRPRAWRRAPTLRRVAHPYHFFHRSSFNAALSSMDSASSFLSLRFSSSSVLSRFASDTSKPPYLGLPVVQRRFRDPVLALQLGCLPRRPLLAHNRDGVGSLRVCRVRHGNEAHRCRRSAVGFLKWGWAVLSRNRNRKRGPVRATRVARP